MHQTGAARWRIDDLLCLLHCSWLTYCHSDCPTLEPQTLSCVLDWALSFCRYECYSRDLVVRAFIARLQDDHDCNKTLGLASTVCCQLFFPSTSNIVSSLYWSYLISRLETWSILCRSSATCLQLTLASGPNAASSFIQTTVWCQLGRSVFEVSHTAPFLFALVWAKVLWDLSYRLRIENDFLYLLRSEGSPVIVFMLVNVCLMLFAWAGTHVHESLCYVDTVGSSLGSKLHG